MWESGGLLTLSPPVARPLWMALGGLLSPEGVIVPLPRGKGVPKVSQTGHFTCQKGWLVVGFAPTIFGLGSDPTLVTAKV